MLIETKLDMIINWGLLPLKGMFNIDQTKKPYHSSISLAKIATILIWECHFKIIGKFIKNNILKETKILMRLWYAKTFVFGGGDPFNLLRVMRDKGTIPLERKKIALQPHNVHLNIFPFSPHNFCWQYLPLILKWLFQL